MAYDHCDSNSTVCYQSRCENIICRSGSEIGLTANSKVTMRSSVISYNNSVSPTPFSTIVTSVQITCPTKTKFLSYNPSKQSPPSLSEQINLQQQQQRLYPTDSQSSVGTSSSFHSASYSPFCPPSRCVPASTSLGLNHSLRPTKSDVMKKEEAFRYDWKKGGVRYEMGASQRKALFTQGDDEDDTVRLHRDSTITMFMPGTRGFEIPSESSMCSLPCAAGRDLVSGKYTVFDAKNLPFAKDIYTVNMESFDFPCTTPPVSVDVSCKPTLAKKKIAKKTIKSSASSEVKKSITSKHEASEDRASKSTTAQKQPVTAATISTAAQKATTVSLSARKKTVEGNKASKTNSARAKTTSVKDNECERQSSSAVPAKKKCVVAAASNTILSPKNKITLLSSTKKEKIGDQEKNKSNCKFSSTFTLSKNENYPKNYKNSNNNSKGSSQISCKYMATPPLTESSTELSQKSSSSTSMRPPCQELCLLPSQILKFPHMYFTPLQPVSDLMMQQTLARDFSFCDPMPLSPMFPQPREISDQNSYLPHVSSPCSSCESPLYFMDDRNNYGIGFSSKLSPTKLPPPLKQPCIISHAPLCEGRFCESNGLNHLKLNDVD